MVFSSISFLFFFLPILFLCYFIVPKKFRNAVLLVFSLLFYIVSEKGYVILLLISCFVNFQIGKKLEGKKKKKHLMIGLIFNVFLLFYFKYTNFFIDNFNQIFNFNIERLGVLLPLGISFFTFQNISYLIDVYRKDTKSETSLLTYFTYISLFPQLVAGPIVRYKDIKKELVERKESIDQFADGITRFIVGLGKKVLIADTLYHTCTAILSSNMSTISYWIVALCFTFQIYYDFSGYSDMAIGLGKMFGFNFKENFNYPLIASSITDFWRRWHMSLSSFFRDYIYIPLGGNRCSVLKNIRNIFIVWFLTGFWHGAGWNFILWGFYFFCFLILEKFVLKKYLKNNILSHIYTFLIVVFSFVIFSIEDISELLRFFQGMVAFNIDISNFEGIYYLKNSFVILIIAFFGMGPFFKNLIIRLKKGKIKRVFDVLEVIFLVVILILSVSVIISSTFNPFIYFRF